MAVGSVEVRVFEEGRRGQDEIGVVGGIGLELFDDDGEEVFAAQASQNRALVGYDGGGVRAVDEERLHRGIAGIGERGAELGHVDEPGGVGLQFGHLQSSSVEVESL